MNDELILYYSVKNCGDGSAYPDFFESAELAEWHQEHQWEGWGESCTGKIVVTGSNLFCDKLQTKEGYYIELYFRKNDEDENNEFVKFTKEFFPDGVPEFKVRILEENNHYYGIYCNDKLVYKDFAYPEKKATVTKARRLEKEIAKA